MASRVAKQLLQLRAVRSSTAQLLQGAAASGCAPMTAAGWIHLSSRLAVGSSPRLFSSQVELEPDTVIVTPATVKYGVKGDIVPVALNLAFAVSAHRASSPLFLENDSVSGTVEKLALLREVFSPSGEESVANASDLLKPTTSGDIVHVLAEVAHPDRRVLVDEYVFSGNKKGYQLSQQGVELFRYLRLNGVDARLTSSMTAPHLNREFRREGPRQSSNHVLMLAPTAFEFNEQTAVDNYYMNATGRTLALSEVRRRVLEEYSALHHVLAEEAGVNVSLFTYEDSHGTPDACFPNNWFSTHIGEGNLGPSEGALVLYSMKARNRQLERRADIIAYLKSSGRYDRVIDLTYSEKEQPPYYCEGTGSLVLDRVNGVAYVAISERSDARLAQEFVDKLGYKEAVLFHTFDSAGHPIYHTNVMMAIGSTVAVVCLDSIKVPKEREHFVSKLSKTHEIIDISQEQTANFCGNVIEVLDDRGLPGFAMSSAAFDAFTPEQKKVLHRHLGGLYHAPIPTIETIGGGGVRCCIAEVF